MCVRWFHPTRELVFNLEIHAAKISSTTKQLRIESNRKQLFLWKFDWPYGYFTWRIGERIYLLSCCWQLKLVFVNASVWNLSKLHWNKISFALDSTMICQYRYIVWLQAATFNQCRLISLSAYGVAMAQWVRYKFNHLSNCSWHEAQMSIVF